jgi:hypothetical protein
MKNIYSGLKIKIDEFNSGKIFNLERIIDNKFKDFYSQINLILQKEKKLREIIENSKYKNFIDFAYFRKYLKENFNKPVKDMISLLNKYEKLLTKQIKELQKQNKNSSAQKLDITNTEILDKNLRLKEINLKKQLEHLLRNKKRLEESLIK